jgi:hypothetical protein
MANAELREGKTTSLRSRLFALLIQMRRTETETPRALGETDSITEVFLNTSFYACQG